MGSENSQRVVALKIPNELGYEKVVRDAVAKVAAEMGFQPDRIEDIKLAVAEACTNAIRHGSEPEQFTNVAVILTTNNEKLEIVVSDPGQGNQAPPDKISLPDIEKMLNGEAKLGGMGLYIIQELMDEVAFLPANNGEGNHFYMAVYRAKQNPAQPTTASTGASV